MYHMLIKYDVHNQHALNTTEDELNWKPFISEIIKETNKQTKCRGKSIHQIIIFFNQSFSFIWNEWNVMDLNAGIIQGQTQDVT